MAINITPTQMVEQWATAVERLKSRLHTFTYRAAIINQSVFRGSFFLQRFYTASSEPWKPRKREQFLSHPKLRRTMAMYESIKVGKPEVSKNVYRSTVYTEPVTETTKRGTRTLSYAGYHNEGNSKTNLPQRQFMGYSTVAGSAMNRAAADIFLNFIV